MIGRDRLGTRYPVKKLADVVEFLDNLRRPVTESDRNPGPYPYYGANGVQGNIDRFIFDEPLVLLAEDGGHFDDPARGIAYRIAGKTWVNNHAHVLRPRPGIDLGFVCRVLENYDVRPFVTGTTRGKLTKAGAGEIPLPIPPLPEQRRIAAILDQADALRAKRREALAQLDSLTQSVFIEMFGEPGSRSQIWPTESLQAVALEINDCPHSTPNWTESGVVCLRTSNIVAGGWNWSDTRYVSETTFQERSKRGYIEPGDIVLSREGTVGIAAIVQPGMRLCMGQRLVQVRPDPARVLPDYLLRHLLYVLSPSRIGQFMVGSTSQHLNVKELRALPVPVAPLTVQESFAKAMSTVQALTDMHNSALAESDALFASLQHRAFAGQLA